MLVDAIIPALDQWRQGCESRVGEFCLGLSEYGYALWPAIEEDLQAK
jgi:hypothetical protein